MNHSVKRRRQALHQTHHHHYLNISVEAANLSDCRIESNRKNRFGSENRIENFLPELECFTAEMAADGTNGSWAEDPADILACRHPGAW